MPSQPMLVRLPTPRAPRPARPRAALRLLALLLLPLAGGCAVFEPSPLATERAALERAMAQWARVGPARYRYVYAPICECPPAATRAAWVTVEDGVVVGAAYVDGTVPVNVGSLAYGSVEQLFATVKEAYDGRAATVRVRYDPALGYPLEFFVDRDATTVDDELAFSATGLVALE